MGEGRAIQDAQAVGAAVRRRMRRELADDLAVFAVALLALVGALLGAPAFVSGVARIQDAFDGHALAAAPPTDAPAGPAATIAPADVRGEGTAHKTFVMVHVAYGPAIAVIIDDLGLDRARTRAAIALPGAITLSFLPYGGATPEMAREARRNGHEVMVHLPMEPVGNANPGPMALSAGLSPEEVRRRMEWALARVPGFAGVNNHMGSRLTTDAQALAPAMRVLAERGIYFIDSRTTANSVAEAVARREGVASAARDVFLDHGGGAGGVRAALARLERIAAERGIALAIGHPYDATLEVLVRWCAEAESRGYRLVPASEAVRRFAAGRRGVVSLAATGG